MTTAAAPGHQYIAGFFDGEGAVMISRGWGTSLFLLSVKISNTDPRPLYLIREQFGGSVIRQERGDDWKAIHTWSVDAAKAEAFLRDIQPYLIVKAERVALALEFRVLFKGENILPRGRHNDLDAQREKRGRILVEREDYFDRMRALNKRGA